MSNIDLIRFSNCIDKIDGVYNSLSCLNKTNVAYIIYAMRDGNSYTEKQIYRSAGLEQSNTSILLSELCSYGYISKQPRSREVYFQITEKLLDHIEIISKFKN